MYKKIKEIIKIPEVNDLKKILFLLIVFCLALGCTGCGETGIIELTDKESKEIAEFSAYLLLKNNKNYEDQLIYPTVITPTPENGPSVTPIPTSAPVGGDGTVSTPGVSVTPTKVPDETKYTNILNFLEDDKLKMSYWGDEISGKYSNGFVSVSASTGNKLWILKFIVANTSSDTVHLDMLEKDISCYIELEDGSKATPEATILLNDLQTASIDIKPKTKQELVLIFNISEKYSIDKAQLYLSAVKKNVRIYLAD